MLHAGPWCWITGAWHGSCLLTCLISMTLLGYSTAEFFCRTPGLVIWPNLYWLESYIRSKRARLRGGVTDVDHLQSSSFIRPPPFVAHPPRDFFTSCAFGDAFLLIVVVKSGWRRYQSFLRSPVSCFSLRNCYSLDCPPDHPVIGLGSSERWWRWDQEEVRSPCS